MARWLFDDQLDIVAFRKPAFGLTGWLGPILFFLCLTVIGIGLSTWFVLANTIFLAALPALFGIALTYLRKGSASSINQKYGPDSPLSGRRAAAGALLFYDCLVLGTGIFWLMYLVFLAIWMFQNPTQIVDVVQLIFVLLACTGLCLLVARLLGTGAIRTGPAGILLPPVFVKDLKYRPFRRWSDLERAALSDKSRSPFPCAIELAFRDGAHCAINTDGLTKRDLERLILSINTYRPDAAVKLAGTSVALSLVSDLAGETDVQPAHSFTELWNAELKRRFGSTAFVPLECGDSRQHEKIKIIGQIAYGGFSAVYLAQLRSGAIVVLKESVIPESADQEMRRKIEDLFQSEATVLAKLNHEQIVGLFDFFIEDERYYLVLEYIEGKTLRQFIAERGPQPEQIVLEWGVQMAGIVEYLHAQEPPVIHRDISPDNLILTREGRIVLIDLGASTYFVGTATGTIIGKRGYMPQEQCCGKTSPQTDIYALGGTLFFLLTGEDPAPLQAISPEKLGWCASDELKNILRVCTAKDPAERMSSASVLRTQLEALRQ